MAKQVIPRSKVDALLEIIVLFPAGISIAEILKHPKCTWPRRTLYRRLESLLKEGKLSVAGRTRNRRYRVPSIVEIDKNINEIPLTTIAADLQAKVRQPIHARTPVGYKRTFLDQYRPNVTSYLPEAIRQKLFELGKTDGERPAGTYARQIFNRLLIDLSWNSSRLEGNTYSLLETERLLEWSEIAEGKDLKEARMILNHKDALKFLVESVDEIGINRYTILNVHALLSNDLLGNFRACGSLRTIPVGIAKTVYHPLAVPQLIDECFQQILDTAKAIKDPYEQAFFLMVHLPYLQPFEDVNKRVSRLAANIPLIQHNLCPLSFADVPETPYISGLLAIYELNRVELLREVFVWAYERSCALYSAVRMEIGDPDPFRMRYRNLISELVQSVVLGKMNKISTLGAIRQKAKDDVPLADQIRFIEEVEKDLLSLHEGNIARHRLRPAEFESWQKNWR